MGAIMSIGVATANSILLVNFANEVRKNGLNAREAALEAGATRLRPVIMTACAMLAGMIRWLWDLAKAANRTRLWGAP